MDDQLLRTEIGRHLAAEEVSELVKTYAVERERPDGKYQSVIVEVRYNDQHGYSVIATDEDRGLTATGNPHPDLETVLATVHWDKLD